MHSGTPRFSLAVLWLIGLSVTGAWFSPARAQSTSFSSNPANGATGVSRTTPMVFTFGKAIDTEASSAVFVQISPSTAFLETTSTWSSGNTVLTCAPVEGTWPATAMIQWSVSATDVDGVEVTVPGPIPGFELPPNGTFTTSAGGGSTDTNPPVLLSSFPANNATGVPINSTVRFTFNEAMQNSQLIEWSANLTAAAFLYDWSADGKTLTCEYGFNLPVNSTITWKLNPGGSAQFKDSAGNALPSDTYLGQFTTSSSVTNDPCNPGPGDPNFGSFQISKMVSYVQTGTADPVEDEESPATFAATVSSPTNNPVTAASVKIPDGSTLSLTSLFGMFFLAEEYTNQVSLDAARPAGNYTLQLTQTTGGQRSAVLTITANDWPTTPHILNLPALQSVNATNDFVVQWNGLVSPQPNDFITISIGPDFYAPDPCVPRPLPNTATQIVVPAGTLAPGQTYDATLSFYTTADSDTNSIPNIYCGASLAKILNFKVQTAAGGSTQPKSPTLATPTVNGNTLQIQITGAAANQSLQVQGSGTLLPGSWTTIETLQADAGGSAAYTGSPTSTPQYYRVVTP